MDPTAVESRHSSFGCTWIVVLYEAVVETLALELRLINQIRNILDRARISAQRSCLVNSVEKTLRNQAPNEGRQRPAQRFITKHEKCEWPLRGPELSGF